MTKINKNNSFEVLPSLSVYDVMGAIIVKLQWFTWSISWIRKIKPSQNIFDYNCVVLDDKLNELYETHTNDRAYAHFYHKFLGDIETEGSLIRISTEGLSENEVLIKQFKETVWWKMNFRAHQKGGHYFFSNSSKENWEIFANKKLP